MDRYQESDHEEEEKMDDLEDEEEESESFEVQFARYLTNTKHQKQKAYIKTMINPMKVWNSVGSNNDLWGKFWRNESTRQIVGSGQTPGWSGGPGWNFLTRAHLWNIQNRFESNLWTLSKAEFKF